MRISYDEKTDSLYLRLKETPYYESDEVKQGILLDYDNNGNSIAIEILDASGYLSHDELASLTYNVQCRESHHQIVEDKAKRSAIARLLVPASITSSPLTWPLASAGALAQAGHTCSPYDFSRRVTPTG